MGYCYHKTTGQLVCDCCGSAKGTKKRTCPHKVGNLPYCSPPALCPTCYQERGGEKIHDRCKVPAEARRREEDRRWEMLAAGHLERSTAWGDWHDNVPAGLVGVKFVGLKSEEYRLLPEATYNAHQWLHEFADAQPWTNPPLTA